MCCDNDSDMKKTKLMDLILPVLTVISYGIYPIFFVYARNLSYLRIDDFIEAVVFFLPFLLLCFFLLVLGTRKIFNSVLLAAIAYFVFLNFKPLELFVESLIPSVQFWHVLYVFITVLVFLGFLINKIPYSSARSVSNTLLLIFTGLLLFNVFVNRSVLSSASREWMNNTLIRIGQVRSTESSELTLHTHPNVYLFLFDEYSGPEALQRYCDYDNSAFYDDLEAIGFNVSTTSHNPTIDTKMIIPNLLNLEELFNYENYTPEAGKESLQNPLLFELFSLAGFRIILLNDQSFLTIPPESVDEYFLPQGKLEVEENLLTLIIDHTALYPLRQKGQDARILEINKMFDFLDADRKPNSSQLLVSYMAFPHIPWVFDKQGEPIPTSSRDNVKDPNIYLGQLQYASKRILGLVRELVERDPSAIIILQSDHAFRQPAFLRNIHGIPIEDEAAEFFAMTNILNAVYYQGHAFDIESLSGVETILQVVNSVLELDLGRAQ